jgi:superfamily II DNA or RNA helicase
MTEHPDLFDHQKNFLDSVKSLDTPTRALLFYKTGAGKSLTAMLGMRELNHDRVLVIAPPATTPQWLKLGQQLDMNVEVMSHAKFRMKDTKLSRTTPIIADEFHLFGGQKGKGWQKFDQLARHLQAPIFLLSATPNYNDAERCYCIVHVLNPHEHKGGYLQFLYTHCQTVANPFSMEPNVIGFRNHPDAASYLADQPNVFYLPDDLVYQIDDIPYDEDLPEELINYRYNRRDHKMIGSIMEARHTARFQGLVSEDGRLKPEIFEGPVTDVLSHRPRPVLIYCNRAAVAQALARSMDRYCMKYAMVTGDTPKLLKHTIIHEFLTRQHDVLIGTATLATGTDGMDKVCDTLLILDDTEDDALRRQLIGRIMPRGDSVSTAAKKVIRLTPN